MEKESQVFVSTLKEQPFGQAKPFSYGFKKRKNVAKNDDEG
jgi:hypothetical protein